MSMNQSQTNAPITVNSSWARFRAVSYLRGRGLSFGVGTSPIYPELAIDSGKYSLNIDIGRVPGVDMVDQDFNIITRSSLDHVFVGNRLAQFTNPEQLLANLVEKLKEGGHLIVYLVQPGLYEQMEGFVGACGVGKPRPSTSGMGRSGYLEVAGVSSGEGCYHPSRRPEACLHSPYGAIGDMIMISPLIRHLKQDGYEVTMNVTPYCAEVLKCNPYVDNIVCRRGMPSQPKTSAHTLEEWLPEYDKYINLF